MNKEIIIKELINKLSKLNPDTEIDYDINDIDNLQLLLVESLNKLDEYQNIIINLKKQKAKLFAIIEDMYHTNKKLKKIISEENIYDED